MQLDLTRVKRVVKLRPYDEETDKRYIQSTLLKSVYMGARCFEGVGEKEFNEKMMSKIYAKVLDSNCLIACNADDPTQIFGYILYKPNNIVDWIYIKKDFRKLKIATYLFTEIFGECDRYEISYPFETYMTQRLKEKFKHRIKMKHNILLW